MSPHTHPDLAHSLLSDMLPEEKKIILVIGATGAQGLAVVDALLAPCEDGTPSPYAVRAFTRNTSSRRARLLATKGVEFAKGSFMDFAAVKKALEGVYGAWVNTDSFTVGEMKETYAGIRIFETAKLLGTVKHYVWSSLDSVGKQTGYNPEYMCDHFTGKARVSEWMQTQPSELGDGMTWSIVSTGPYMDTIVIPTWGPINVRADGTVVFATPIGRGHVPFIALQDLGWWARYSFDHREEVSRKDLKIASDVVSYEQIVDTFKRVTGKKAVHIDIPIDDWFDLWTNPDRELAHEAGPGTTTFRQNFTAFMKLFRDDVLVRDMEWIRNTHPKTLSLEDWMRRTNYRGAMNVHFLKIHEDGSAGTSGPRPELVSKL